MSENELEPTKAPWINDFFVIIPHATGAAILMMASDKGWRLPAVRGEDLWYAMTAKIHALLRESLGLTFDFTILRYAAMEASEQERWERLLFVLEPHPPLHHPPLNGHWVDHATLASLSIARPEQRDVLLGYLQENQEGATSARIDARRAPWARPGWFAAAASWIQEAVAEQGHTLTGPVEQLRNWSISSLLAAPTSAGRVYFKAAAALPLFVNEPALTQTLSELFPTHLPTPLKIDREKRWMLMEDFGTVARGDEDVDYAEIYATYGKLQRESARHLDRLAAAGCIDRRLEVLAGQIDVLIADPLTRSALTGPEYDELVTLAPRLKERCRQVAEYKIPATLLHGDLHPGNITQRNGEYIYFDWTDAAISFPFLDLFIFYFEIEDAAEYERGRDAYLAVWQQGEETVERLREAWDLAKPLCALHHSISYLTIAKHVEPLTRDELYHGLPDNLRRLLEAMRV